MTTSTRTIANHFYSTINLMQKISAIRGMNDMLPSQSAAWLHLERALSDLTRAYGYEAIRTPIVESTALFQRGIGEVTDIVEKEMYSFEDRLNR
jgi:histidyl-tRNA synthetase